MENQHRFVYIIYFLTYFIFNCYLFIKQECTDERLKKLNELLLGIKIIKLNAWEKVFKERIIEVRNKELKCLDRDSFYWTAMSE